MLTALIAGTALILAIGMFTLAMGQFNDAAKTEVRTTSTPDAYDFAFLRAGLKGAVETALAALATTGQIHFVDHKKSIRPGPDKHTDAEGSIDEGYVREDDTFARAIFAIVEKRNGVSGPELMEAVRNEGIFTNLSDRQRALGLRADTRPAVTLGWSSAGLIALAALVLLAAGGDSAKAFGFVLLMVAVAVAVVCSSLARKKPRAALELLAVTRDATRQRHLRLSETAPILGVALFGGAVIAGLLPLSSYAFGNLVPAATGGGTSSCSSTSCSSSGDSSGCNSSSCGGECGGGCGS